MEKKTGFCVYHFEKYHKKSNMKALDGHIMRLEKFKKTFKHADPNRCVFNKDLSSEKYKHLELREAVNLHIKDYYKHKNKDGSLRKIKSDAVYFHSHVLSASHEDMFELVQSPDKFEAWIRANYDWLADKFGKNNIIKFVVHLDEKTPHIHAVTVPITSEGKLNAKSFTGKGEQLAQLQDSYGEAMAKFGFKRGIKDTGKKHISTRDFYYKMINDLDVGLGTKMDEIKILFKNLQITSNNIQEARASLAETKQDLEKKIENIVSDEFVKEAKKIINDSYRKYCDIHKAKVYLNKIQNAALAKIVKVKTSVQSYLLSLKESGLIKIIKRIGDWLYFKKQGKGKKSYALNLSKDHFVSLEKPLDKLDIFDAARIFEDLNFPDAVKYFATYEDVAEVQKITEDLTSSNKKVIQEINDIEDINVLDYIKSIGLEKEDIKNYGHEITCLNKNTGRKKKLLGFRSGNGHRAYYMYWPTGQESTLDIGRVESVTYDVGSREAGIIKFFSDHIDFLSYKKLHPYEKNYKAMILNNSPIEDIYHKIDKELKKDMYLSFEIYLKTDEINKSIAKCIEEGYKPKGIDINSQISFFEKMGVSGYKELLKLKINSESHLLLKTKFETTSYYDIVSNSILLNKIQQNRIGPEEWILMKKIINDIGKIKNKL